MNSLSPNREGWSLTKMLIQFLAPAMPTLVLFFILLNMFQLHMIIEKMVTWERRTKALAAKKEPSTILLLKGTRNINPEAHTPEQTSSREANGSVSGDRLKHWFSKLPIYWTGLLILSFLLFSFFFMSPAMRFSPNQDLDLTWGNTLMSFLAVERRYVGPAFVTHLWEASLLFVVQAFLTWNVDCEIKGKWMRCRRNDRILRITEKVTLVLGVLSVLISLSTARIMG
jgi:hypothetical protein